MKTSFIRLFAALAFVLPVATMVASPVMAARHHHVHKVAHKVHKKTVAAPTAS